MAWKMAPVVIAHPLRLPQMLALKVSEIPLSRRPEAIQRSGEAGTQRCPWALDPVLENVLLDHIASR
eukprot:2178164-Amphidinium_carterae.1